MFHGTQVPVTFGSHIPLEHAEKALHSEPFETWCRRCERRIPLLWQDDDDDDKNKETAEQAIDSIMNQDSVLMKNASGGQQQQPKKSQYYQQLELHSVEFQSIDMFGPRRVGFIKLKSHVTLTTLVQDPNINSNDKGNAILRKVPKSHDDKALPGICFLRGSAVSILVALFCQSSTTTTTTENSPEQTQDQSTTEVYSLLVEQPRVPIGQVACLELPAGMVDSEKATISGIALQELREECGIEIDPKSSALIDLTELAFGENNCSSSCCSVRLPSAAIPPSPGGCDEVLRLFYLEKNVTREELQAMRGRLHGLREEGEFITLRVVPMDQLWKVSGDGKAMM